MREVSFDDAGKKCSANGGSYTDYTLEDRAKIGKYTAENGPARASRHLSVPAQGSYNVHR